MEKERQRGLRGFYQTHMHVGRTLFMFPRMVSCLRSGKEPEEGKKILNRKEEHVRARQTPKTGGGGIKNTKLKKSKAARLVNSEVEN